MATKLLVLSLFLSLLSLAAPLGTRRSPQLSEAQQCRIRRISASQPSKRIVSEGGVTEQWDEQEDQFQCVGVAAQRNTLRPNSLSLPNFHPYPRMVFIERGQGVIGINFPGCADTFNTRSRQSSKGQQREEKQQQEQWQGSRDHHQKVHRFQQGDIIAIPAGAVHWTFNDGNEELVAVSINDLSNPANQLDLTSRSFYLAGGASSQGTQTHHQGWQNFQNIFSGFDAELLAEAFNVPTEVVRRMQREDERGLIVQVQKRMSIIMPEEEQREEQWGQRSNGLEETFCSTKIHYNLDNQREADIVSRQAGKLNIVNQHKLPILKILDLSAEKGNLLPNALFTPHWSMNSHSIIYVTRGDAQVQIVSENGQTVFDDRVNEGDMFVVPQFFAATSRAGQKGFEWVSFKTNRSPMKSPLAGYTSVFRAMPLQVITNAYQISPNQAQNLKLNRGSETYLLSPKRTSS